MSGYDELSIRMKDYEKRQRFYLQKRMPVIIRLDMRTGHTFLRDFKRPFDDVFIKTMQETALYLCKNIQNVKCSYQQSDEITLLLVDYDRITTNRFFEYRIDKLCSLAAGMATLEFNKRLEKNVAEYKKAFEKNTTISDIDFEKEIEYFKILDKAIKKGAIFDARCFNQPKEEVTNNFYWRQMDASRNSIQMVGQAFFTQKELDKKNNNDIQDMLMTQKGINWNNLPTYQKRGSCCIKKEYAVNDNGEEVEVDCVTDVDEPVENVTFRSRWIIDTDIPIFKGEGRDYIERFVYLDEK